MNAKIMHTNFTVAISIVHQVSTQVTLVTKCYYNRVTKLHVTMITVAILMV